MRMHNQARLVIAVATLGLLVTARAARSQNLTVKGTTIGEGNARFYQGVGVGTTATPAVKLSVGGGGANVYATDAWVENNMHVQGNEGLAQGGRGRLRLGSAWGYAGVYADGSSTGAANDLVLGASTARVRIGCDSCGHNLLVSGNVTQRVRDVGTGAANQHALTFTGWSSKPYIEATIDGTYVGINVFWSSRRFKKNVRELRLEAGKLAQLRPVEFEWDERTVPARGTAIGLIAEEVYGLYPELVTMRDGAPFSVNYELLSVLLLADLNAQREEGQAVRTLLRSQQAEIEELKGAVRALRATTRAAGR